MMLPPRSEQVGDASTTGILGFKLRDAIDRILASEREQRVTAPRGPLLEAPKRLAAVVDRILSAPPPDCERRRQQLGAATLDLAENSWARE